MHSNTFHFPNVMANGIATVFAMGILAIPNVLMAAASDVKCDTPCIQAKEIDKKAVKRSHIRGNAVDSSKIKDGSVTGIDIKDETITSVDILDQSIVGSSDIRDGSISGNQIRDGSIRSSDIGSDAISSSKILDEPGIEFFTSRLHVELPEFQSVTVLTLAINTIAPGYVTCSVGAQMNRDNFGSGQKTFWLKWQQNDSVDAFAWDVHGYPIEVKNATTSATFIHPAGHSNYTFVAKYEDFAGDNSAIGYIDVRKNNARCMYFPTRY